MSDAVATPSGDAPAAAAATPTSATTADPAPGASPEGAGSGATDATQQVAVEKAPESYTDFKAPEGKEIPAEVASEVKTLAKDLGLTQEKAQKVFDAAAKLSEQHTTKWYADRDAARNKWAEDTRNDKEFGGEKLAENLAKAKAAMEATSSPEFVRILNESGLGNHPEMVRHFLKIAPAFAQDSHVASSTAPTSARQSIAKSLYPNNA